MSDLLEPKKEQLDPLPCITAQLNDEDDKDSDEDENTLAKSLINEIIEETENAQP